MENRGLWKRQSCPSAILQGSHKLAHLGRSTLVYLNFQCCASSYGTVHWSPCAVVVKRQKNTEDGGKLRRVFPQLGWNRLCARAGKSRVQGGAFQHCLTCIRGKRVPVQQAANLSGYLFRQEDETYGRLGNMSASC